MKFSSKKMLAMFGVIALAAALIAPSAAAAVTTIKLSGSTTVYPVAQILATQYHKRFPTYAVTVTGGGSSVGISDVLAGRVNIGMSSRDLKQSEKDAGAVGTVFAKDALTVIVNKYSPVTKLTEAQIRDIYTGKITNWKVVGGPNARIVLCGRTAASGTYEYFKSSFLNGTRQSSSTRQYASNGMVRSAVAQNRYAIGYVSMAYLNTSIKGLSVKADGASSYAYPSRYHAQTGKYGFVRPLYWVTKGAPAGAAKSFIAWTRTTTGQTYVKTEFLGYR